ncbi:MAG: TetR family transcriptional regulator [Rhodoferax sp.]|uniref:TetR family transcriptional regulator n=1 Tax=Rhodoferax sp. TaxID=50421 RepID=UPI00326628F1
MARKTKEDAEHTYSALLEAAEQMFFDKGVAHTTLADIASAAGMTRGAIYWHFKDKGALLQALFAQATLPMENMLAEATAYTATDPLGALRNICVQALTTLAGSPRQQRVFNILFHKCENVGEVANVLQHEIACRDECQAKFETILLEAIAQGQLPADTDVFLSRQTVHNFTVGTMREWLLEPQSYPLASAAPAMVDMLIAGLRTCPPRVPPG